MTQGAPNPFSREGSHPGDGLGADAVTQRTRVSFGGPRSAPTPVDAEPFPDSAPWPWGGGAYAPDPRPAAPFAPAQPDPYASSPFPAYPQAQAQAPNPYATPYAPTPYAPQQFATYPPNPYAWRPTTQGSPFATASLVAGILGLFFILTGPIAIGLGIAGLRQVKTQPETYTGEGVAIGGIVTGAFGTFVLLMVILAAML